MFPSAPLIHSLREEAQQLCQRFQLPARTEHYMLGHIAQLLAFHSPQAGALRLLADNQVVLLTIDYAQESRSLWTLQLFPIHREGTHRIGWLAAAASYLLPRTIKITDVTVSSDYQNGSLGSWLITTFLQHCPSESWEEVVGYIAQVDFGQAKKLAHFYGKHGFTVQLDWNQRTGNIERRVEPLRTGAP